jgi:hypothetical protein
MKHLEEDLEKVLAGLRNVDPPPAMERRILQSLEKKTRP